MFFGMDSATPLPNISVAACRDRCDAMASGCEGFTFESDDPMPASLLSECYVTAKPSKNLMDMSNNKECDGATSPSDCPFHLYRVSGDIQPSWKSVLANLAYTLPFLGQGGVHAPHA